MSPWPEVLPPGLSVRRFVFSHTIVPYDATRASMDGGRTGLPDQLDFSSNTAPYSRGTPSMALDTAVRAHQSLIGVRLHTVASGATLRVVGIFPRSYRISPASSFTYQPRPGNNALFVYTDTVTAGTSVRWLDTYQYMQPYQVISSAAINASGVPTTLSGTWTAHGQSASHWVSGSGNYPRIDFVRSDIKLLRALQWWSNAGKNRAEPTVMKSNGNLQGETTSYYSLCVRGLEGALMTQGNQPRVTDILEVIPAGPGVYMGTGSGYMQRLEGRFVDSGMMRCDLPLDGFEVFFRNSDGEPMVPGLDAWGSEWFVCLDLVLDGRAQ